jgi:hypothetical protein
MPALRHSTGRMCTLNADDKDKLGLVGGGGFFKAATE